MNVDAAIEALNHSLPQRIGWVLLHTLWQGGLIGLGFALVRLGLRTRSANARYLAGCFFLVLLLAAPVVTLIVSTTPATENGIGSFEVPLAPATEGAGTQGGSSQTATAWLVSRLAEFFGHAAPYLAAFWIVGVTTFSLRLSRSCWGVRRLRSSVHEAVDPGWLERLADLRCRLEISRPVLLFKSTFVVVPSVIGWLRPVILLPVASVAGLSPGQLDAILAHELAHIRRHDYLVNVFQCVMETLMFYHPMVWWISRCVREERELCCDDMVVKVCGDRLTYARALAALEESRGELPALAFAASGGSLLNRIRRLLGAPTEGGPATAGQISGLALLTIGVVFTVLGAYLALAPPIYQAVVRMRIEREPPARSESQEGGVIATSYDPYFFQTESHIIQSEMVLVKVIEELRLGEAWGRNQSEGKPLEVPETLNRLRKRLSLRALRDTTLVEIRVSGQIPSEAANIANAVARAYRDYRQQQRLQLGYANIKNLEERFEEQARKIREAQSNLDKLREELKIDDSLESDAPPTDVESVRRLERLRIEKESQFMAEQTLFSGLTNLSREQLIQTLPTALATPDPLLNSLLEQMTMAEQSLVVRQKELGEAHPDIAKTRGQIEDLTKKINIRVEGILIGFSQRVDSLKQGLVKLQLELEKATAGDIERARRSRERARQTRPYFEAKRKLEEVERFGQILSMKIASEKIEAALPKSTLAQIVDSARLPLRPSARNRSRGLALILLGLMLDGAGVALLRSGRRILTPLAAVPPPPASSAG